MNRTMNAQLVDLEGIKEMVDLEALNPMIDKLMFLETRPTKNMPSKIFPCYVEAYSENEPTRLLIDIFQLRNGEYSLIQVEESSEDLGKKFVLWNGVPTNDLRGKISPFVDSEVPQ